MQHRFAKGLGGDGACVDADAADHPPLLDDGDALAHFGGLNGGALARGTGTNNDKIIFHDERLHVMSKMNLVS